MLRANPTDGNRAVPRWLGITSIFTPVSRFAALFAVIARQNRVDMQKRPRK